jgi:CRP-like cAMP-binding protein
MTNAAVPPACTPEQLRTLFLFEKLDQDKLEFLCEQGRMEHFPAGTDIYREGEEATCFYTVVNGTVSLSRRIRGDDVEVSRTDQRGVYGGAM